MTASDPHLLLPALAAVFLLAGFVKGAIGLGLPTIAMGLMSLALAPPQAAALLLLPSLASNVWQLAGAPGLGALARRLAPMLAGVCAGTALGAGWLVDGPRQAAGLALGLALAAYALFGLAGRPWQLDARHEAWCGPLVGLLTGLVTAATGVFVIPAVPYLQALGLARDRLVQALGLSFLVSTLALGAALGHGGAVAAHTLGGSALALLPTLAGMALGQRLRRRTDPLRFRRWFFGALLVLGAYLALRAFAGR